MKYLIVIFSVICLAGCEQEYSRHPIKTESADTTIVGKFEDCTLYRTNTLGSSPDITWVRCKNEPKVVQSQHCGKNCRRTVLTTTTEEVCEQ